MSLQIYPGYGIQKDYYTTPHRTCIQNMHSEPEFHVQHAQKRAWTTENYNSFILILNGLHPKGAIFNCNSMTI